MLRALFWKEWQEQSWRLALASIGLIGFTAIGLKTRIVPDEATIMITLIISVLILPMFSGMGLLASERTAGTFKHLMAQPIPRQRVLLAKVGMGLTSYALPILVTCVIVCVTVGGRELPTARLLEQYTALLAFGMVVFAWSLFIGLGCAREERYILMNIIVLVSWAVHGITVDEFELTQRFGQWAWDMNPFALIELLDGSPRLIVRDCLLAGAVQGVILLGLGYGIWIRFKRINGRAY